MTEHQTISSRINQCWSINIHFFVMFIYSSFALSTLFHRSLARSLSRSFVRMKWIYLQRVCVCVFVPYSLYDIRCFEYVHCFRLVICSFFQYSSSSSFCVHLFFVNSVNILILKNAHTCAIYIWWRTISITMLGYRVCCHYGYHRHWSCRCRRRRRCCCYGNEFEITTIKK